MRMSDRPVAPQVRAKAANGCAIRRHDLFVSGLKGKDRRGISTAPLPEKPCHHVEPIGIACALGIRGLPRSRGSRQPQQSCKAETLSLGALKAESTTSCKAGFKFDKRGVAVKV